MRGVPPYPSSSKRSATASTSVPPSADASSFRDRKAEFESGDADWTDDVSDSPGGDMRLDE